MALTTQAEHAEHESAEVLHERLDQLLRARNCLIIRQKDAKKELAELHDQIHDTVPGRKERKRRRSNVPDRRYQLLNRTRSINVRLQEWEKEFNDQLIAYNKALCLPVAEAVIDRLPREVRDLIYGHMMHNRLPPNDKFDLTHREMPKKMWDIQTIIFPWSYWGKFLRHYEDSEYVGLPFAKELVEMYYRVCTFAIREESFDIIDTFLQQKPCGYGLVVSEILCHLELTISFKNCIKMDRSDNYDYKIEFEETVKETGKQKQRLAKQLHALLRMERRCKIDLNLWIWHGKAGLFQFGELVDMLLPIISELKGRECTVNVTVNSLDLMTYGSTKFRGKWVIQDTVLEPSDAILKAAMKTFHLPGVESADGVQCRAFAAKFIPTQPAQ